MSNTAAILSPIGSWFRNPFTSTQPFPFCRPVRCLRESRRPRVALQVRIGLDRAGRGPDGLDLTVGADEADTGGLVDVLGGAVDGDVALRQVERDAAGVSRGLYLRDVEGTGLLDRCLPQVDGVV